MSKKISIIGFFKKIYLSTFISNTQLCRIKHINLEKHEIIIFCRGTNVLITLSFEQLIDDQDMIANFIPTESSVIGYYFGRYYISHLNKKTYSLTSFNFIEKNLKHACTIKMIDRYKNIIFSSGESNETRTLSPINIFEDKKLLGKFGPLQACYIGILTGIYSEKSNRSRSKQPMKNNLSLVSKIP